MMMKKLVIGLLLGVSVLLAGCTGDNAATAVQYLDALNQRDLETAQSLVCDARQDDVAMGLTTVDDPTVEPFAFKNVSCTSQGSGVLCRFVVDQRAEDQAFTDVENSREVVFHFEDGKVCGFDEEVAQ